YTNFARCANLLITAIIVIAAALLGRAGKGIVQAAQTLDELIGPPLILRSSWYIHWGEWPKTGSGPWHSLTDLENVSLAACVGLSLISPAVAPLFLRDWRWRSEIGGLRVPKIIAGPIRSEGRRCRRLVIECHPGIVRAPLGRRSQTPPQR